MATLEFPSARVGAFTRLKHEVEDLLETEEDENKEGLIMQKLELLKTKRSSFIALCEDEFTKESISQEEMAQFRKVYLEKLSGMDQFIDNVQLWIQQQNQLPEENENVSVSLAEENRSVRSNSTRNSTRSSKASYKIAEQKAKYEAEKLNREKLLKLKNSQRQIRDQIEEIKFRQRGQELELLESHLDENDEFYDVEEAHFNDAVSRHKDSTKSCILKTPRHKRCDSDSNSKGRNNNMLLAQVLNKQNDITCALIKNQERSLLPRHEPDIFDGNDVTCFRPFMHAFERIIDLHCDDNADKYYLLDKYTAGRAKQLVRSCDNGNPSEAYSKAIAVLHKKYGNEYVISEAYLNKLQAWPDIKSEDPKAVEDLSLYLTTCLNLMSSSDGMKQLNNHKDIRNVVQKLPFDMRKGWRKQTCKFIEEGTNIEFRHLEEFVALQARILNQPVFGEIKDVNQVEKRKWQLDQNFKKAFATRVDRIDDSTMCLCCKRNNHILSECFFFKNKPSEEKIAFIKRNSLCFSCLSIGHTSRTCNNRLVCQICKYRHPTVLHKSESKAEGHIMDQEKINSNSALGTDKKDLSKVVEEENNKKVTALSVKSILNKSEKILCAAVPVQIRIKGQNTCVYTYMGLDGYSTDCFIDNSLLSELGIEGYATSLNLTTLGKSSFNRVNARVIQDLEIISIQNNDSLCIPEVYAIKDWPFTKDDAPKQSDIVDYDHLNTLPFIYLNRSIGILAGINVPTLQKPLEVVSGIESEPYAIRYRFGWAVSGPISFSKDSVNRKRSFYVNNAEMQLLEEKIDYFYNKDFVDCDWGERGPSIEDELWLKRVKDSFRKQQDGHYEIALPFREHNVKMPCNYRQAWGRVMGLKRKFLHDEKLLEEYKAFMDHMLQRKYMELVPTDKLNLQSDKQWFLIHFGIYHKQKNKLRVVFDCSLKNNGVSLNDKLLQGPDLINNLIGVLLRFRKGRIAFMADIEKMFFQVKVTPEHTDYMRVLWFPDGDIEKNPIQYRLTSHTFGAVSSPSIANYALKQTAYESAFKFSEEARQSVLENFYVDDFVKAVDREDQAIALLKEVKEIVLQGGFNLTAVVSNSRNVLESVSTIDLGKKFKDLNLDIDKLPEDRALGVVWLIEDDCFSFKIKIAGNKETRRGMLSIISSVYDPLGLANPVIVKARALFQATCKRKLDWNDKLPSDLVKPWSIWLENISKLENFKVPRCLYGCLKGDIQYQLHIFCDGSLVAFGAVAYIRACNERGQVHCSLIMSKARQTPINNKSLKTVPRIELNAARLAVNIYRLLKKELHISFEGEYFWVDSMTVLKYINNDAARYHRFVANRVSLIRSMTQKSQWHYIPGEKNIADLLSRGIDAENFLKDETWQTGPKFLLETTSHWPVMPKIESISEEDVEVKRQVTVATIFVKNDDVISVLFASTSDWIKLKYRVAAFLRLKQGLKNKDWTKGPISTFEFDRAEIEVWKHVQHMEYKNEIKELDAKKPLKVGHILEKLYPFIDKNGLLRVGGRLRNSDESEWTRHPIILPSKSACVELLVYFYHKKIGHMGRNFLLSELREKYWIVSATTLVKKISRQCIICRKIQGSPCQQLMAPLPIERVDGGHNPFFYTGVDYFGPFLVARGRTNEKRYGVVFTCMTTRAVHFECANSLDVDSFINALRRFICRRGEIRNIISDNGTNFVGSCRELKKSIDGWNLNTLNTWFNQRGIVWKFNPPSASHFGGAWERVIRSARKILCALLHEQPRKLSDELLQTLFCEVENILNNRPLTPLSDDPLDFRVLTPNYLLLLKPSSAPPPGVFEDNENFARKRWRLIQNMANNFWLRWRKEYLRLLQERQKWRRDKTSCSVGDLVLVSDAMLPRNQWSMGRIVEVRKSDDGHVRSAKIRVTRCNNNDKVVLTEIERPIAKCIWLMSG